MKLRSWIDHLEVAKQMRVDLVCASSILTTFSTYKRAPTFIEWAINRQNFMVSYLGLIVYADNAQLNLNNIESWDMYCKHCARMLDYQVVQRQKQLT